MRLSVGGPGKGGDVGWPDGLSVQHEAGVNEEVVRVVNDLSFNFQS